MNRYIVGVFLVIISGVCYGFAPILAVYAYQGGATVSDYVFLRYGIASLFYLLYIAIFKCSICSMLGKIPMVLLAAAGTSQAVGAYLYMSTVKSVSAGLAAILFYTYIVWVAVWGFIFNLSPAAWMASIASAIISCNIALFTFNAGMKLVGSTTASVLCTIEPVTTVVFSALLLSQKMTAPQLLGGLVILMGAILVVTSNNQSDSIVDQKDLSNVMDSY